MNPARLALLALAALLALPAAAGAAPGGSDDSARAVPGEILVGFKDGASGAERERAAERAQAAGRERVTRGDGKLELLRLKPGRRNSDAVDAVAQDPAVAYAEPNWRVTAAATSSDPFFTNGSLWGMGGPNGSQASTAWAADHTGSASVYVGVIDEGIQFDHPDLNGQVWNNTFDPTGGGDNDGNGYVDDVHGYDFANNDNTIYDGGTKGRLDDHGTHVSGTIGAKSNGQGVVGVNWGVTLISGKFLGRNGGTIANAVRAVDYFTDLKTRHGLNLVATNNSWGGGGFSQALLGAITRANTANILFVAAAGNSGTNNDTTASYPSNYNVDNVIAVAAIDSAGRLATFSQYGATTVDLGAPGVGVWSTTAFNTYSSFSGTSMATPHVTGGAALYASTHPGATATAIKDAILTSARLTPTPSLSGKTVTGGRLNVSGF